MRVQTCLSYVIRCVAALALLAAVMTSPDPPFENFGRLKAA